MQTQIPRNISKRGIQALNLAFLFISGMGIFLLITILLLLHWLLIRPITTLTESILAIGKSGDLNQPVVLDRKDEIGTLSEEFDYMINQLGEARKRLMDQSYQAGMARQATDVLHNVGNVLNTVNISTDLLDEKIQKSSAKDLRKTVALIEQNKKDLPRFLIQDPKGRLLPEYLSKLVDQIEHEHQEWEELLKSLKKNNDHIKQIVSMQQNYTTTSGIIESIAPNEILEDALKINEQGLVRHQIEVRRKYRDTPPVLVDKQKVLQILVNLISNAKYSISQASENDRILTLRLFKESDTTIRFDVIDTGEGISKENMNKLFSHGFTTKKKGHGFGLHSAANIAREMEGSLTGSSEGPGRGAAFTLRIPIEPKR
jgi:signal transduction histidine kinase